MNYNIYPFYNDVFFRLTQAMIVFHEELMEEIYDWINDAEKQAESIAVNEDNINSVMEEYKRHRVISMFYWISAFLGVALSIAYSQ